MMNIQKNTKLIIRGFTGVLLIILGLFAFFTPLTPGSWLVIIGFQILGWRTLWRGRKNDQKIKNVNPDHRN